MGGRTASYQLMASSLGEGGIPEACINLELAHRASMARRVRIRVTVARSRIRGRPVMSVRRKSRRAVDMKANKLTRPSETDIPSERVIGGPMGS